MGDATGKLRQEDIAPAIIGVVDHLHAAAQAEKDRSQRLFNQLISRAERSGLSNGATLATVAMFAAGVVATHCREAETAAEKDLTISHNAAEHVAFVTASAFATLMQTYIQEFMARAPNMPMEN